MKKQNMRKNIFLTLFVLGGFLLGIVTPVTITNSLTVNDAVCPPPSTIDQNAEAQSQGSSTMIDYTSTSSYYDNTNLQYSEVMVRTGDANNPFKFVYFDSNSIKHEVACAGTAGYIFIRLINNFLFLKDANLLPTFYVCQFDPATVANSVSGFTLKNISLTAGTVRLIPYSVRETTIGSEWVINIAFGNQSSTSVAKYIWSTIDSISNSLSSTISTGISIIDGVEDVIYNNIDGFTVLSTGTYAADSRLVAPASGSTIVFYRTLTRTSLIGVYASGLLSASFYLVSYTAQLDITAFTDIATTSTTAYVDYFDDSANIMVISANQVAWLNVAANGSLMKLIATTTQIPTANLHSVQFMGTTAVFTYTDLLVTYEMSANNTATKTLSRSTLQPVVLSSTDHKKIYALSCFCRLLRTVMCYSSTLNCLLISKGTANCPPEQSIG